VYFVVVFKECSWKSCGSSDGEGGASLKPSSFVLTIASTLANQSTSPLLRLPAELRNRIYTLTFSNKIVRVVPSRLRGASGQDNKYTGPVALLLTSRQLYAETSNLFLRTCIFDISPAVSRHEFIETVGHRRCKKVEAVMVTLRAFFKMMGPAWEPEKSGNSSGVEKPFGAVRWVYLMKLFKDDRTWNGRLNCIFEHGAFVFVGDDRARYQA
jgi:hypothetical protein